ncbi:MAG: hypothetical protein WA294_10775 [Acidobacteriaceae bacterium]
MRIEKAIEEINRPAGRWVRLEKVRWSRGHLALSFGIHKGKRGGRFDAWMFQCSEVLDANITALDGGGLAMYRSSHPAARQFAARQAEVRWHGVSDEVVGALYKAHIEAVDDWIPFGSYSNIRAISNDNFSCRGPDFLMRAYARALRAIAKQPQIILARAKPDAIRPGVLHFGGSYVVANRFTAERHSDE